MSIMVLIIAFINFLSAFLQASTGFGYAILAMFLMPMFMPFNQCSLISAAVIIVIAIQMTFSLRKNIRIRKVLIPMLACLVTTWAGVYIVQILDITSIRKVMGVFLIMLAVYFYYIKKHDIKIKESIRNGILIGLLTGLSTGMFNIVGPFLTLYYYDNFDSTLEFKANLEFSFLIAGLFSLFLNTAYTRIDTEILIHILASGAASLIAGVLGLKLFYKIDKEKLKYIIIGVLPIMGLIQIFK